MQQDRPNVDLRGLTNIRKVSRTQLKAPVTKQMVLVVGVFFCPQKTKPMQHKRFTQARQNVRRCLHVRQQKADYRKPPFVDG